MYVYIILLEKCQNEGCIQGCISNVYTYIECNIQCGT